MISHRVMRMTQVRPRKKIPFPMTSRTGPKGRPQGRGSRPTIQAVPRLLVKKVVLRDACLACTWYLVNIEWRAFIVLHAPTSRRPAFTSCRMVDRRHAGRCSPPLRYRTPVRL